MKEQGGAVLVGYTISQSIRPREMLRSRCVDAYPSPTSPFVKCPYSRIAQLMRNQKRQVVGINR